MGKVIMPKNTAEIEKAMKIYYDSNDWLSNAEFIELYKKEFGIIGDDNDSSAYTKTNEVGRYYGFIECESFNASAPRRITERGRKYWEHLVEDDKDGIHEDIMSALEEITFGKKNYGCFGSDSFVEPPCLFVRAALSLGYITNKEFAYLLYQIADNEMYFIDAINDIRNMRETGERIELPQEANKYTDIKAILFLERGGVFASKRDGHEKHTSIAQEFLEKYQNRLVDLSIYNTNKRIKKKSAKYGDLNTSDVFGGENVLYYGVPGSGKSRKIDDIVQGKTYERVVFHPDYTYSDFVGQIMPRLKIDDEGNEKLSYKFVPGPFTKIMREAINNKTEMFYLIIEEINRGNAPAIFGDVFQLLDRETNGEGKYYITNFDIAREVYLDENEKVKLPANLTILATMNTSDQNVFTLDTAFQRRWNMTYVPNEIVKAEHVWEEIKCSKVRWGPFAKVVNEKILDYNTEILGAEDKQLGAYFIKEGELDTEHFPEKALKYLWDDVFKMDRTLIFDKEIKSIGALIGTYKAEAENKKDPIKRVMDAEVYKRMMDMSAGSPEEAFEDDEKYPARKDD